MDIHDTKRFRDAHSFFRAANSTLPPDSNQDLSESLAVLPSKVLDEVVAQMREDRAPIGTFDRLVDDLVRARLCHSR